MLFDELHKLWNWPARAISGPLKAYMSATLQHLLCAAYVVVQHLYGLFACSFEPLCIPLTTPSRPANGTTGRKELNPKGLLLGIISWLPASLVLLHHWPCPRTFQSTGCDRCFFRRWLCRVRSLQKFGWSKLALAKKWSLFLANLLEVPSDLAMLAWHACTKSWYFSVFWGFVIDQGS